MRFRAGRMSPFATRCGMMAATTPAFLLFAMVASRTFAQSPSAGTQAPTAAAGREKGEADRGEKSAPAPPQAKVKLGLVTNDSGTFRGYTLLNPMNHKKAYLIDVEGRIVKTWESEHQSTHPAYLLEDGHVLRVATLGEERAFGGGGGSAGRVQEFDWDGKLVWDFRFNNAKQYPHHDALKLPNGNVLIIVWDKKTRDEAIAAGRKKELVSEYVMPDSVLEFKPTGKTTGEVVWEWHLWDHLVQDHDATKANYGDVASHPERVDINFIEHSMDPGPGPRGPDTKAAGKDAEPKRDAAKDAANKAEAEKLKTIGYVGTPKQQSQRVNPDWTHVNSVDYNAELDQIVISVHELSEIWIIDHSTTRAEAAGHTGGRSGQGRRPALSLGQPPRLPRRHQGRSDALRPAQRPLDPPAASRRGAPARLQQRRAPARRELFVGRRAGPPGRRAGAVQARAGEGLRAHEARLELLGAEENRLLLVLHLGRPAAPQRQHVHLLRCQRHALRGDAGSAGRLEVRQSREGRLRPLRRRRAAVPNQVLPGFLRDTLHLSDAQKKEIDAVQKTVDETLDMALTDAQKKTLRERSAPGPGGSAGMPSPGQIMSVSTQVTLKPTPEQRTQLSDLQKTVDATLEKVLTDDQKKQLKQMRADFARGGPGGPGGGPPGRPGGPGGGPPGGSGIFRAYKYSPDYAGLAGKDLKPGKTVEELQPKEPEKPREPEKSKEPEKPKGAKKTKETASQ